MPKRAHREKVIAAAERLVAQNRVRESIAEYEKLLSDEQFDAITLNRIGDLYARLGDVSSATEIFATVAKHYANGGFFLKAIAIYKKINKLDPSRLDVYEDLAGLYAQQGLAMEAKSQYQVLGDYYLKHGDPANALRIYLRVSEVDPNSIIVHVKLADLYSQTSQIAEALKEYDRVGQMLLKRSMIDEAVQVFKKALKIDANNVKLTESLATATALLEAKEFNDARQIVETPVAENVTPAPDPTAELPVAGVPLIRTAADMLVFLCHASEDKPAVRELYARLSKDAYHPWLDEEDLLPGQNWEAEIKRAVRRSHVVLICLSSRSETKAGFLQKEIRFALDVLDEQPEGIIFVVPARLEECRVPESLKHLHYVDLFLDTGYRRLRRALDARAQQLGFVLGAG